MMLRRRPRALLAPTSMLVLFVLFQHLLLLVPTTRAFLIGHPATPAATSLARLKSSSRAAHGSFYHHTSEEEGEETPLWLMAPAVGLARRLGGELVEMGLAKRVSLFPSLVETWEATDDGRRSTARSGGVRKEAALLVAPREGAVRLIRRHVARVLNEETAEIDEEETAAAAVAAADVEDSDDDGFGNPFGAFAGREGMDPFAAAVATAAAVTRGRAIMPPSSNPSPANAGPIPSARLTGEHAASQFPPPPPPPLSMGMESGGLWEFEEVDMDAIDLEMLEEDPDEDVMVVETDDFVLVSEEEEEEEEEEDDAELEGEEEEEEEVEEFDDVHASLLGW